MYGGVLSRSSKAIVKSSYIGQTLITLDKMKEVTVLQHSRRFSYFHKNYRKPSILSVAKE